MIQKIVLGLLIIVGLTNCRGEPLISGNDLEIIVTNEEENVSSQVFVKLYLSKSYYQEGIAWDSLITDEQGTVHFYGLDPQITEFYVEATKGKATNWGYRHQIALAPGINRMVTKIEESRENLIVGKLGKDWKQTGYVVDGISNEECAYRRVYRFGRDGTVQIYTSDECTWAENYVAEDVWELRYQNIVIGSPTNPSAQKNGFIQILEDDKMQFYYQKKGANGTSTYVETFEITD